MSKAKKSGSSFLVQGSILAIASIVSRIIGLIYRVPMTEIIGDEGNNFYGCAFDIYNVMLIISSYSLPLAVSKLVSAKMARKQRRNAYQIFKGAMLFALVLGGTVALILFFGADFFTAKIMKTPYSVFALRILAPNLVIVAVLGVLRGFFQGMGTMMPSAISQVIEQIVNAIVSIWAAYSLVQYGTKVGAVLGNPEQYAAAYGAAGGTLGTNIGAVAGLLFTVFIFFMYMTTFKRKMKRERNVNVDSFQYTMRLLFITIIPVLLSTTIYNISDIIDQGIYKNIAALLGYKDTAVSVAWGVYTGKYRLLINVPIAVASAIAASSVPTLTRSFEQKDMDMVFSQISSAMRFLMVVAFPSAVGLTVLAKPILLLLFPGTAATADFGAFMMVIGAIAVVFYSVSTLSNAILQGINHFDEPVKNAAISLVLHIILLVILMLFFHLDIYAVVIANALFSLMVCILNGLALKKYIGYKHEIKRTFLIPAVCSAIMGVLTYGTYYGIYAATKSNTIAIIPAFLIAVISYAVCLLLLKGLTEEEILRFPMGSKIVMVAKKLHLLR